jgi:hypothetical protein
MATSPSSPAVKTWIVGLITAFAIGALAGAALACYYVESEYRE